MAMSAPRARTIAFLIAWEVGVAVAAGALLVIPQMTPAGAGGADRVGSAVPMLAAVSTAFGVAAWLTHAAVVRWLTSRTLHAGRPLHVDARTSAICGALSFAACFTLDSVFGGFLSGIVGMLGGCVLLPAALTIAVLRIRARSDVTV